MSKTHRELPVNNTRQWFRAVEQNDTKRIEQMLHHGFDIETRNDSGRTGLHVAAQRNALNVAGVLLAHKANIEAQMSDEGTPLLDAAASGHVRMCMLLLQHGANPCVKDESGWGIMHWIAHENKVKLADALYTQFPTLLPQLITAKRWNGISPLHMVTSAAMAKKLIALGAPVDDETSEYGSTPLIEATEQNELDVVKCLVRQGANILHTNHDHLTAADIAINMDYPEIKVFFQETLSKQNNSKRNKTHYKDNVTAALAQHYKGVDEQLIQRHASLRMDLFFLTLIAYYNSKLTIDIEQTNRQHGQGAQQTNTAACHSAILTSLWDTTRQRTGHQYNTRHTPEHTSYRTGILNGTHLEDSLNMTVELDKSVNYFDTHYIEGRTKTNQKMRACALNILNDVSSGKADPIEGMNTFLTSMHSHLLAIKTSYIDHIDLQTSPIQTRPTIFSAQFKGSFFNTCGVGSARSTRREIVLKEDYIQAQLPLSKEDRIQLRENPGLFSVRVKQKIYQKAYLQAKKDMDLPVQYQGTGR